MDINVDRVFWDDKPLNDKVKDLTTAATALESTANSLKAVPMNVSPEENTKRIRDSLRRARLYRLAAERLALLARSGINVSFQELEATLEVA